MKQEDFFGYINERYGLSVSADDLEQVLRSGYFASRGKVFEDSKVFIEELKYELLQQIIQFAKSRGYTFNMSDIHFVGGGAIILRRYIKQEFPHSVILDNLLYSNCLSFLKILEVKYGQVHDIEQIYQYAKKKASGKWTCLKRNCRM